MSLLPLLPCSSFYPRSRSVRALGVPIRLCVSATRIRHACGMWMPSTSTAPPPATGKSHFAFGRLLFFHDFPLHWLSLCLKPTLQAPKAYTAVKVRAKMYSQLFAEERRRAGRFRGGKHYEFATVSVNRQTCHKDLPPDALASEKSSDRRLFTSRVSFLIPVMKSKYFPPKAAIYAREREREKWQS